MPDSVHESIMRTICTTPPAPMRLGPRSRIRSPGARRHAGSDFDGWQFGETAAPVSRRLPQRPAWKTLTVAVPQGHNFAAGGIKREDSLAEPGQRKDHSFLARAIAVIARLTLGDGGRTGQGDHPPVANEGNFAMSRRECRPARCR